MRNCGPITEAGREFLSSWDRYVEAHALRGHEGPHQPDPILDDDCGLCVSAMYGTEVEVVEYTIPALREALGQQERPGESLPTNHPTAGADLSSACPYRVCKGERGHSGPHLFEQPQIDALLAEARAEGFAAGLAALNGIDAPVPQNSRKEKS